MPPLDHEAVKRWRRVDATARAVEGLRLKPLETSRRRWIEQAGHKLCSTGPGPKVVLIKEEQEHDGSVDACSMTIAEGSEWVACNGVESSLAAVILLSFTTVSMAKGVGQDKSCRRGQPASGPGFARRQGPRNTLSLQGLGTRPGIAAVDDGVQKGTE